MPDLPWKFYRTPVSLTDHELPKANETIPVTQYLESKNVCNLFSPNTHAANKDIKCTDISALPLKITSCVMPIYCAVSSISDFLNTGFQRIMLQFLYSVCIYCI